MKLIELKATGTYVAVVPTLASMALLKCWAEQNNLILDDHLHITVLYSRKVLPTKVNPEEQYRATPVKLGSLGTAKLVLFLDSPSLKLRHKELINQGHTHDFEDIIIHMTLSNEGPIPKDLELPDFGLAFEGEYTEALSE